MSLETTALRPPQPMKLYQQRPYLGSPVMKAGYRSSRVRGYLGFTSSPWYRWSIEIDGLPNLKMVDLSMAMLNNQMAYLQNGATRLLIWFMTPIKFGL